MFNIRKATLQDVKSIHTLLNDFAKKGDLLGRPLTALYERVREFFVCTNESGEIIACIALSIIWEDLAEIRSLAVHEDYQKKKIGVKLLQNCLEEAYRLKIKKLFTLTYRPVFFEKAEFHQVDKHELPHKIWADCIHCPHFPDCNEIALIRNL